MEIVNTKEVILSNYVIQSRFHSGVCTFVVVGLKGPFFNT